MNRRVGKALWMKVVDQTGQLHDHTASFYKFTLHTTLPLCSSFPMTKPTTTVTRCRTDHQYLRVTFSDTCKKKEKEEGEQKRTEGRCLSTCRFEFLDSCDSYQ